MDDSNNQTPADIHAETITAAITLAASEPDKALTLKVYEALASLAAQPETSGRYQLLLDELAGSHKAFSKVEIRKHVDAFLMSTVVAVKNARDVLSQGVEPWGEEVDGCELARDIKARIERHCVLPDGAAVSITLWLMAAYCIDSFRLFPKLLLTSPQPRCGKSTLLEVLAAFVPRPLIGSNVSASVIFRAIQAWQVSVLLDEVDTFIHGNEELRGIINSGHTQANAFVWRIVGESSSLEPKPFSTWAPMVIAMIKTPPDTVLDRSIWCQLQRKTNDDKVERLPRNLVDACLDLRRQCQRWSDDNGHKMETLEPDMPKSSNDRAEDNYRTLAAVAGVIGGDWPSLLREAYKQAILKQTTADTNDLSLALLSDIRDVINDRPDDKKIASSVVVDLLNDMNDRPWSTVTNGEPLTPYRLSQLLKPYGLKPSKCDAAGNQFRGYLVEKLKEVCTRYLSEVEPFPSDNLDTGVQMEGMASDQCFNRTPSEFQSVQGYTGVSDILPRTDTLKKEGVRLNAYSDGVSYTRTPTHGGKDTQAPASTDDCSATEENTSELDIIQPDEVEL